MEVAQTYPLLQGDPRLIDHIVCELKSQGIFDQFRKECISDVDTKPAYQNLRQRVEGSVAGFLSQQSFKPELNKNQLREKLRKHILDSNFLDQGVERIVDQVVNPKIASVFVPQVEDVLHKCYGFEKPSRPPRSLSNGTYDTASSLQVNTDDLLPNDLESVSPDSVKSHENKRSLTPTESYSPPGHIQHVQMIEKKEEPEHKPAIIDPVDSDSSKEEEFESPAFEPLEGSFKREDSPDNCHLSGMSDLTSHESNDSTNPKATVQIPKPDVQNTDSQLSQVSSDSNLSMDTSDSRNKNDTLKINLDNDNDNSAKAEASDTGNNTPCYKFSADDNSSDARQCFEMAPTKMMDIKEIAISDLENESSADRTPKQRDNDIIKSTSSSEVAGETPHHRSSIDSKTSSESKANADVNMDSNESKSSIVSMMINKDGKATPKETYSFENRINPLVDNSLEVNDLSNDCSKINLDDTAVSVQANVDVSVGDVPMPDDIEMKSPGDVKDRSERSHKSRDRKSDSHKSRSKDSSRHSSSHRDRRDDSKHHSGSHSRHSSSSKHRSSHDKRDSSQHKSGSKESHSDKEKQSKSSNDESKKNPSSSSHKSSSSSKTSKHSGDHKHHTSDEKSKHSSNSDRGSRHSLTRVESKDSVKSDKDSKSNDGKDGHKNQSSKHEEKSSDHPEKSRTSSSGSQKDKSSKHSHSDKSRRSSSHSTSDKKQDDKKSKDKSGKDDHCSSSKTPRIRRSTDRDSNDGNNASTKTPSSNQSSSTAVQASGKDNKSSSSSSDNGSNGNNSSGQSDSLKRDLINITAGGYITSEFNMFQPLPKKPTLAELNLMNKSTENITKKPVVNIDSQLTPVKVEEKPSDESSVELPVQALKKPKFASNFDEAKRLMKVRKQMDKVEKERQQDAIKATEMKMNVPESESQVYSGLSGPELEFACVKDYSTDSGSSTTRSKGTPPKKKRKSPSEMSPPLRYFDEDSKKKSALAYEKMKKVLKSLTPTTNGLHESVLHLMSCDRNLEQAFKRLSTKNNIIRTVNLHQNGFVKKVSFSKQNSMSPSFKTDDANKQGSCVKKGIMKSPPQNNVRLSNDDKIKQGPVVEIKRLHLETSKPYYKSSSLNSSVEYQDEDYCEAEEKVIEPSAMDIMEIIFGSNATFETAIVDLKHVQSANLQSSVEVKDSPASPDCDFNDPEEVVPSRKRKVSPRASSDEDALGINHNNNLAGAKRRRLIRKVAISEDVLPASTNNSSPTSSILNSSSAGIPMGKARRIGLSKNRKSGSFRNKLNTSHGDIPQSPESDKSVENHFHRGATRPYSSRLLSQELSSNALNNANHQTKRLTTPTTKKKFNTNRCLSEKLYRNGYLPKEQA